MKGTRLEVSEPHPWFIRILSCRRYFAKYKDVCETSWSLKSSKWAGLEHSLSKLKKMLTCLVKYSLEVQGIISWLLSGYVSQIWKLWLCDLEISAHHPLGQLLTHAFTKYGDEYEASLVDSRINLSKKTSETSTTQFNINLRKLNKAS